MSAQKIIDLKLSPLSEDKATRLVIERRKGGGLNLPLWMLLAVALVGILLFHLGLDCGVSPDLR